MTSKIFIRSLLFATIAASCVFAIAAPQNITFSLDAEAALVAANEASRKGDLGTALREYQIITERFADTNAAARALVSIGRLYEDLNQDSNAQKAYERAVSRYGRTDSAITAQARLDALKGAKAEPHDVINGPVWSGPSGSASAWKAISPDGQFLISDSLRTRNIRTGKGGEIGDAISNQFIFGSSVVSTDGSEIAFLYLRNPFSFGIRSLPLNATNGTKARTLASTFSLLDLAIPELFGWSPQSGTAFVLLTENDKSYRIVEASAGQQSMRTIVSLEMWQRPANPSLSPDARHIAFDAQISRGSNRRGIFVLSTGGGSATLTLDDGAENTRPVWTPDGNGIVYASNHRESSELRLAPVADGMPTGGTVSLKTNGRRIWPVGFARNGTFLFAIQTSSFQEVRTAEIDLDKGMVKASVSKRADPLENDFSPAYSPDGTHLAYFSQNTQRLDNNGGNSSGLVGITVQSSAPGGDQRRIPTQYVEANGLSWFDDQSVVFAGRSIGEIPGAVRLRRFSLDGRELPVDQVAVSLDSPTRVFHGEIYYLANGTGVSGPQPTRKLMAYSVENRRERILFEGPIAGFSLTLSPDGRLAAVMVDENPASSHRTVALISTAGGLRKRLTLSETPFSDFVPVDWSSDGNHLIVRAFDGSLWRIPIDGGIPIRIGSGEFPAAEAIRPDKKEIAFASERARQEIQLWIDRDLLRSIRNGTDIYLARVEGNGTRIDRPVAPLAENLIFSNQAPVWSPNDELIAFKRLRQESGGTLFLEIVVRNLKTGKETFSGVPGGARPPLWFHDNQSLLQGGNVPNKEGYLLRWNSVTGKQEDVFRDPALLTTNNGLVAITRDDKTMYIGIKEGLEDIIIVLDVMSGKERERIHLGANVNARVIALSPDGRTFAVIAGNPPKDSQVFLIGVDGKDSRVLYTGDGLLNNIIWSHDGHSVLVGKLLGRDSNNTWQIMRIPWDAGVPQPLGLQVKDLKFFSLSHDGSRIAYDGSSSDFVRIPSTR